MVNTRVATHLIVLLSGLKLCKWQASLMLQIDRTDSTYGRLARFTGRLKSVLDRPKVQADAYLPHVLDDFLGAIYALILAKSQGFTVRPRGISPEPDKVQTRAEQVANGHIRLDGKLMAGFHFNSAILRLSAVYHRILRVLTNDHRREAPAKPAGSKKHGRLEVEGGVGHETAEDAGSQSEARVDRKELGCSAEMHDKSEDQRAESVYEESAVRKRSRECTGRPQHDA